MACLAVQALDPEQRRRLEALMARRWAALAVAAGAGRPPELSFVAFAPAPELGGLVLHLSRLARHTRLLLRGGPASLGVSEPEGEGKDPQTLARLALQGPVEVLEPGDPRHVPARRRYLERLPWAEPRFAFADFHLFLLRPQRARWVGGFGRALDLDPVGLVGGTGPGAPP